jgi:hypothetical protein
MKPFVGPSYDVPHCAYHNIFYIQIPHAIFCSREGTHIAQSFALLGDTG